MRIRLLMLVTASLVLAPASPSAAGAAADHCPVDVTGARWSARVAWADDGENARRSLVVLCDRRTGRERRLASRRVDWRAGGRTVDAAAASTRELAWIERSYRRRHLTATVLVRADPRHPERDQRRLVYERWGPATPLDVAYTGHGTLVLATPSGVWVGGRLVDPRLGEHLGIEDGRTLRYTIGGVHVYRDLAPLPRDATGCPVRERFARVAVTRDVVLSRAHYGPRDRRTASTRACLRATGRDPLVAVGHDPGGFGSSVGSSVLAISAPWVVVATDSTSRYYGCESTWLQAIDLRTSAAGPKSYVFSCDPPLVPRRGEPLVVTDAGRIAWIDRSPGRWSIRLAAAGDAPPAILDEGAPGELTSLRADGTTVVWRAGADERRAQPGG